MKRDLPRCSRKPTAPTRAAGALCLALLVSCSTPGTYRAPAADAPAATVLGETRPWTAFLDPLSSQAETSFLHVDGETLPSSGWSGYPSEIRVSPGLHRIGVRGRVYVNGNIIARGSEEVVQALIAGQTYQARTLLQPGGIVRFAIEPIDAGKSQPAR